jgi:hypothetical protein
MAQDAQPGKPDSPGPAEYAATGIGEAGAANLSAKIDSVSLSKYDFKFPLRTANAVGTAVAHYEKWITHSLLPLIRCEMPIA